MLPAVPTGGFIDCSAEGWTDNLTWPVFTESWLTGVKLQLGKIIGETLFREGILLWIGSPMPAC